MSNSVSRTPLLVRNFPLLLSILISALILITPTMTTANVSRSDLTAAYLFRLAENIQWPNAAGISRYRVHLIDSSQATSQALKNIARRNSLHGKPFRVTQSRLTSVPEGVHLVYLARSKAGAFTEVLRQIEGKPILFITDQVTSKQQIMLNLFETAGKQVQFEINKANILNQNLGVNPDIILLGGTEIDVARLYREGQRQLQTLEQQLQELDNKRQLMQQSAVKFEQEATLLARELDKQKQAVRREQERLKKAEIQTRQQQQEIERHRKELEQQDKLIAEHKEAVEWERARLNVAEIKFQRQQKKLSDQGQLVLKLQQAIQNEQARFKAAEAQTQTLQAQINAQERQVAEKLQKYEQLTLQVQQQEEALARQELQIRERAATIQQQDTTISSQTEQLAEQSDIIGAQQDYLIAMGLAVAFGAVQALIILFSYRAKQQANNRLSQQNLVLEKTTEQLSMAKKAADNANRAKTVFLTTMSHELRTPLNAILGFSQLMQRDPSMPESQKEKLSIINSSGEHLLGLINDVLEVSKIEAGRITLTTSTFDLHHMLDGLESIFQGRLEDKDVELRFEKDSALPQFITTDQGKVRQMLINLLGNALKFTERGSISLKASLVHTSAPAVVNGGQAADTPAQLLLRFEVTDTGVGIAKKDFSKIFTPFDQAADGARKEGSTGLGLSISQRYAQLMGGQITFSSQQGVGTTFYVEIKALAGKQEDEDAAQLLPTVASLAPDQSEIRTLVVDDNFTNRLLLDKMLSAVGFVVRTAANGREALDIFHQWHPQLLLLDVKMPVMDGIEVTRRLRAIPEGKDVVIIIVSASAFEQQKQELLALGANAYIRKPIREDKLFTEIQRHLDVHYLYQEPTDKIATHKLHRQDIAKLPASLRKAFSQAVLVGDIERLGELAAEAADHDAAVGATLQTMVENFELNSIQELFSSE